MSALVEGDDASETETVGEAVCFTRDLVNTPPNALTPADLSGETWVENLGASLVFDVDIFDNTHIVVAHIHFTQCKQVSQHF